MRWTRRGRSRYVEDRRAETGRRFPFGFPQGGGRFGRASVRAPKPSLGGILILLVFAVCFREQFLQLLSSLPEANVSAPPVGAPGPLQTSAAEDEVVEFVSFVLDDLQQNWAGALPGYKPARLVLFRDAIGSACGFAQSAMGPF